MKNLEYELSKIIPYNQNPKVHPDYQVDVIARSIKEFGFDQPIVLDKDNVIIKGHGRYLASLKLGLKSVPVIVRDDLTEEEIKASRIMDNKSAESEWDIDSLIAELSELNDLDYNMDLTGFNEDELEALLKEDDPGGSGGKEDVPEVPDQTIVKIGDIWVCGKHRVMCGDSTNLDHLKLLMGDEKAEMGLTDPPYNVDYHGGTPDALKIANDNMTDEDFYAFLLKAHENMAEFIEPGGALYVFHADSEGLNFRKAYNESGFLLKQCCIWVKNSLVLGRQDFQWQHEPCLYGWKPGASHRWRSDRKQTTIWNFDRPSKSIEHPTMKPVQLFEYPISCSSIVGDIVLDVFGGSGTTVIACEKLHRRARTIELSPLYVEVIIKFWQEFTGEKAVCENNPEKVIL